MRITPEELYRRTTMLESVVQSLQSQLSWNTQTGLISLPTGGAGGCSAHQRFISTWGMPSTGFVKVGTRDCYLGAGARDATFWWNDEEVRAILTFRLVGNSGSFDLAGSGSTPSASDQVFLDLAGFGDAGPTGSGNPFDGVTNYTLEPDDGAPIVAGIAYDGTSHYVLGVERVGSRVDLSYFDASSETWNRLRYDTPSSTETWYFHLEFWLPKDPNTTVGTYAGNLVESADGDFYEFTCSGGGGGSTHALEWHWFEFDQAAETTPSTDCLLLCGSSRLDTADYSYDASLQAKKETVDGTTQWSLVWCTFQCTLTDGWDTRLLTTPGAGDSLSLNFSRLLPALETLLVSADATLTGIDLRIGGPQSVSPSHWQALGTVSFNGTTGPFLPCYGRWSNDGYCLLAYQDATSGGLKVIAHDDATVEAGQVRLGLSFPLFLPLDPNSDTPVKRTSTWRTL